MQQGHTLSRGGRTVEVARRHYTPALLIAALVAGYAYSLQTISTYALTDSPLGFVPLVPIIALAMFLYDGRERRDAHTSKRDGFLDWVIAGPALVAALYILLFLPNQQSIYFWLHRLDLLTLPLVAIALVSLLWGAHVVFRMWRTLGYLFFLWPYPIIWFQALASNFFTDVSAVAARGIVEALNLPFMPDPDALRNITYTGDGSNQLLIIDQVCSGLTAFLGFPTVGAPLALFLRGSKTMRVVWLFTGAIVALFSNVLRVSLLLVAINAFGFDTAMDYAHPIMGFALFLLVLVVMVAALPLFGLKLPLRPTAHTHRWVWEAPSRESVSRGAIIALLLIVGVTAGLNQNLRYFGWNDLNIAEAAPLEISRPTDLMPQDLAGRRLVYTEDVDWPELFGKSSTGAIFVYRGTQGDPIGAQVVLAKDLGGFRRYSVENCVLFHGDTVYGSREVFLGHGVTATIVNERTEGFDGSRIYWIQPVEMNGERYHARVMIYADQVESMQPLGNDERAVARKEPPLYKPVQRFLDIVDGKESAPSERFAAVDSHLLVSAEQLLDQIFAGSAPAPSASQATAR